MKNYYDTRTETEEEDDDFYDGPSKSQKKRDSEAMQKLGLELARLGTDQLARIDLPEDILDAINDYKKMKSFGALRRQAQLIGKLMRKLDGAAVREAIDRATGESRAAVAALHRAERLRDAMIEDDKAVTSYIEENPEADVQRLRQLVRAARKERDQAKPPKSARELYKLLYASVLPPLTLELTQDEEEE
ncbi:MAG: ribosome biogenesis factor YjgA [Sutterellaceae bacterium]|nr:ribosome biogenesis factor YjgA [Sutterellaceae bacterium]